MGRAKAKIQIGDMYLFDDGAVCTVTGRTRAFIYFTVAGDKIPRWRKPDEFLNGAVQKLATGGVVETK